jgi:hypothetical protein
LTDNFFSLFAFLDGSDEIDDNAEHDTTRILSSLLPIYVYGDGTYRNAWEVASPANGRKKN